MDDSQEMRPSWLRQPFLAFSCRKPSVHPGARESRPSACSGAQLHSNCMCLDPQIRYPNGNPTSNPEEDFERNRCDRLPGFRITHSSLKLPPGGSSSYCSAPAGISTTADLVQICTAVRNMSLVIPSKQPDLTLMTLAGSPERDTGR